MNLYVGDLVTTMSTLLVVGLWVYVIYMFTQHKKIERWGKWIAILLGYGLIVCCFVATRDGYHLSVQNSIDVSVAGGLFSLASIQSTLCCIGGAIIGLCALGTLVLKKQQHRKIIFFILGCDVIFKTLVIEISRLFLR